jgi:site-specific DNA recombinase
LSKNALGYARVSTGAQEEAQTIEIQIDRITSYCRETKVELVDIIRDDGVSGADADRAMRLVSACAEHKDTVNRLIVTTLDRLARELFLQLYIEKELSKLGISIVPIQQPNLNGEDYMVKAMRQMVGVFSELEKNQIKHRLKSGIMRRETKGFRAHGPLPFGYQYDRNTHPKEVILDEQAASLVRHIYKLVLEMGMKRKKGYRSAAGYVQDQIQGMGIHRQRYRNSKTVRVDRLNNHDVNNIVTNPFYCGYLTTLDGWIKAQHQPLVSREDWIRANKILCRQGRRHRRGKTPTLPPKH